MCVEFSSACPSLTDIPAVEIAEAIREKVEAEAKKRMKAGVRQEEPCANLAQGSNGKTRTTLAKRVGGRPKKDTEPSGKLPEGSKRETRTILAKRVGMSERTYDKARKVVLANLAKSMQVAKMAT